MKTSKDHKKHSLKPLIVVLCILALTGAVWFAIHRYSQNTVDRPSETSSGYINMDPATKDDQSYSDSKKQDSSTDDITNPPTEQKQQVTPIITTWGQNSENLTVNGFVQNIVEDNGICTLTLKMGSRTVVQSRQAVSNATNTSCGQTDVALSRLSPGTWQTTITYNSATAQGTSASRDITVN